MGMSVSFLKCFERYHARVFQDEDAGATASEDLNGLPKMKLILNPGGCAYYTFPLKEDQVSSLTLLIPVLSSKQFQVNCFIQPARKMGDYYPDFCNKPPVNVNLENLSGNQMSFSCFDNELDPTMNCSANACLNEISGLHTSSGEDILTVEICSSSDSPFNAALWEINFSSSNESSKIQGNTTF